MKESVKGGAIEQRFPFGPLVEIILVLTPVLTIMWITPLLVADKVERDRVDFYLSLLTLLIAASLNVYHREGFKLIGLRMDNFVAAVRPLIWFTAISGLIVLAIGWAFDSIHLGARFVHHLEVLPFWGLLQQYGIQSIINRRWQMVVGRGRLSVGLTAVTFAALHLPNPALVITTLIGGAVWAWVFQRHPNLVALALSHALLSALMANAFPPTLLPNMKVGWGYWSAGA